MTGKSAVDKSHKTQDQVCYRLKRNFSTESEHPGQATLYARREGVKEGSPA